MIAANPKTVLITGAARGIGRACADLFAQRGWSVLALDQSAPEAPFADGHDFLQVDLADQAALESLGSELAQRNLQLSALVNNAAYQPVGPIAEMDSGDWDRTLAVNLKAPYQLAQACLPHFAQPAAIVNIVSVHALATSPHISAYAASKGGLLALTRAMALELAQRGIRANAVLPGATDTEMLQKGLERGPASPAENQQQLEERILLGRLGRPEEMARAVYFLADEEQSSYITGQSLVVDGGALARLSTE